MKQEQDLRDQKKEMIDQLNSTLYDALRVFSLFVLLNTYFI